MAHVEGAVVVYLRRALGILDADLKGAAVQEIPRRYLLIEKTREVATILMLLTLALLVGETWPERIVIFFWTFAFWDLFYYLSLYLLIKWPPNLTTIDVLFLIPHPWIAPVWLPIGISSLIIILIAALYLSSIL